MYSTEPVSVPALPPNSMDAADGYAMDIKVYFNFLRDIDLVNEDSVYCSTEALEEIFYDANFEEDSKGKIVFREVIIGTVVANSRGIAVARIQVISQTSRLVL